MNDVRLNIALATAVARPSGIVWRLGRLRYQLLLGLIATVCLPILVYHLDNLTNALETPALYSAVGGGAGFIVSLNLYRRVMTFPGVRMMSYAMPAVAAGYGIVLAVFIGARLEYSRFSLAVSFAVALAFLLALSFLARGRMLLNLYVVPSSHSKPLTRLPGVRWILLQEPHIPPDPRAVLVADLRDDLGDEWERLIAKAALDGFPVYHSKLVEESLTGKVELEHLSENNFGSLIPNLNYHKIKRLGDVVATLLIAPVLLIPGLIIAALIKLDSPGPVLFRQTRRGYRGHTFTVFKFRTMMHRPGPVSERHSAITQVNDKRITKIGRVLRRARIDELPQLWNVIRGDMSLIGPRPEVLSLSEWYMDEVPFYTYRHIVRPGITGWAQVNQGHVADLEDIREKLKYDFYYIKNFSAWLDLLILIRTIGIVFSGSGAK